MGKTNQIDNLAQQRQDFQNYLNQLQANLDTKAKNAGADLQNIISKFYQDNKYDDAVDVLSSKNYDFMQLAEFKLDNLLNVVAAISKIIFSGTSSDKLPSGVKVDQNGVDSAKDSIKSFAGEGVKAVDSMETYIANKVFDIIGNVVLSSNTTSAISYSTVVKSEPLGYGLQLFVSISSDSFTNSSFLNNDIIYEYLYICDVKFSKKQAQTEAGIMLAKLYNDQIAVFTRKIEDLLDSLSAGTMTPQAYQSSVSIYNSMIADSKASLQKLSS